MKKFPIAVALSLLTVTAYAATATTPAASSSLAGNYQCKRSDGSNNTTTTTLTITKNTQAYTFEWDNDSGNPVLLGSGDMHPNLPNVISVAFSDPKNIKGFGVELFSIKPDGSLEASWAIQSSNTAGSEICTKK